MVGKVVSSVRTIFPGSFLSPVPGRHAAYESRVVREFNGENSSLLGADRNVSHCAVARCRKRRGNGEGRRKSHSPSLCRMPRAGQIADVTVVGNEVHGHYRTGKENFHTIVPSNYPDMYKVLGRPSGQRHHQGFAGQRVVQYPAAAVADSSVRRAVVLYAAANADGRQQGHVLREE